jgi:hypothetical protein
MPSYSTKGLSASHGLAALVVCPLTLFLCIWTLMAESGGKDSNPIAAAVMLWGAAELVRTSISANRVRQSRISLPPEENLLLLIGLVMVFLLFPGAMAMVFNLNNPWALLIPYGCLIAGSRMTRRAIVGRAAETRQETTARTL